MPINMLVPQEAGFKLPDSAWTPSTATVGKMSSQTSMQIEADLATKSSIAFDPTVFVPLAYECYPSERTQLPLSTLSLRNSIEA